MSIQEEWINLLGEKFDDSEWVRMSFSDWFREQPLWIKLLLKEHIIKLKKENPETKNYWEQLEILKKAINGGDLK